MIHALTALPAKINSKDAEQLEVRSVVTIAMAAVLCRERTPKLPVMEWAILRYRLNAVVQILAKQRTTRLHLELELLEDQVDRIQGYFAQPL